MSMKFTSPAPLAEMLADSSIDRVMAIDTQWRIIAWNKTAERITGIAREDLLQRPLLQAFPEITLEPDLTNAIIQALRGQQTFVPAKMGAFNRHYYENHFIPLRQEEQVFGVMNIMHDVAHRVKAERQLEKLNRQLTEQHQQQQKANAELVTFTNITGNELKEPIKKVYTTLEMIARSDGPRLSMGSKASLRRMQSSLNRMNLLLDDLMALAAASSFTREFVAVDLNEVLAEAREALHPKMLEKQAQAGSDKLPVIQGNRQMLRYLFVNLLDNALKFQPEGNIPVITITTDYTQGDASAGQAPEKKYVCLHFADNGIGFAQSDAERVFAMFDKLPSEHKYGGSGIGLTISRKIAEAHGGYIQARSEPGKGAVFTCCFAME